MKSRYEVRLTEEDREFLTRIVRQGRSPAYRIKHAHILLHADSAKEEPEKTDEEIADYYIVTVKPFSISGRSFARMD